ncbi:hypothetical protein ACMGD3_23585 [Lysinibacillus sphaericus]|uniref:hypothetical protein n=1 Tax=Lysinibacillus sphaericus TaxID=1421 RepID=UPI003F7A0120
MEKSGHQLTVKARLAQLTFHGDEEPPWIAVSLYPALTVSKTPHPVEGSGHQLTVKARLVQLTFHGDEEPPWIAVSLYPHRVTFRSIPIIHQ